jgi:hypothetical protein
MLAKEVPFFVRSTYIRGFENGLKGSFLISHYHERSDAEKHYNSIQHDKKRFLYDASNPEHIEKLKIAASELPGYKVFSVLIAHGKDEEATKLFRYHTEKYLRANTNWTLTGRVKINPKLYFQLGEVYVRISNEGQTITLKFEEIENS